jgi:hypothetical protein
MKAERLASQNEAGTGLSECEELIHNGGIRFIAVF